MKRLLIILLFWLLDNNLILSSPPEVLSAYAKTIIGVTLICSGYGCQKFMNYIIRRDTNDLLESIIKMEAHPWENRQTQNPNQRQEEITYLRYASKIVSGSLGSAGCLFLYGAYNSDQP
ncbi:MAG TPA: hypothetical protein VHO47_01935 [Candidatus Babeliales bacterium]|nr:hypothetical protein [Candidatus Babeliales bacterium]